MKKGDVSRETSPIQSRYTKITPSQGGSVSRSMPSRTQNRCKVTASTAKPLGHGSVTSRGVSPVFSAV